MNRLPSSASFQGVLDSIIRNYLLNELPPEGAENGSTRHHVAEKDLGFLQASGLHLHESHPSHTNLQTASEVNNNTGPVPGTSTANVNANTFASINPTDQEYIKAVYQCFEKRGVFKELQTFLRHKLVSILQDEWPNLQKPVSANKKEPNSIIYRLVEDFLRCHKLLYTLSVLASEADVKPQSSRVLYGKLSSKEAEDLLDEMGMKRGSRLSGQILKCYFDKENFSLLESMNYLGIWLDDSSIQLDNLQQENETKLGRRKGSAGESIILSHCRQGKEKATETTFITEIKEEKRESENIVGVEQRLLELERNLEREKEFKIKEATEKYKKEELVKLREELETRFKLQLIEKEREHFLDVQKKMNEINSEIQQERQQWVEVKLKQERELSEIRQQMSEMMNASGDANWKNARAPMIDGREGHLRTLNKVTTTATKTCQVSFEDNLENKCVCQTRSCACYPKGSEPYSAGHKSVVSTIEQDRLAFLQYRMEQQDEEIKSLRMKLLASSQYPISKSSRKDTTRSVQHDANASPVRQTDTIGASTSSNSARSDELSSFLSQSRARVKKLDTAVDKVDEIVQELFSKSRSPLSKDLSSHLLSQAMKKNVSSLSQLYSSLHNMTVPNDTSLFSAIHFPSAVPLVHQQVPEKQRTFTTSVLGSPPSPAPITRFYDGIDLFAPPPPACLFRSPPPMKYLCRRSETTIKSSPRDLNCPGTPTDRIFEVAYGQQIQNTSPKQSEIQDGNDGINGRFPGTSGTDTKNDNAGQLGAAYVQPEQSLFHMAMLNSDGENQRRDSDSLTSKKTLEQTAVRIGALSREKILSSDEGEENSISISLSFSGSKNPKVVRSILKPSIENGIHKNNSVKSISKNQVSESADKTPLKAPSGNVQLKDDRRQSLVTQVIVKSKDNSAASPPSSSSRKSAPKSSKMSSPRENLEAQKQKDEENEIDEQSSLSISAPKSIEGEENNEDFWQL